MSEHEQRFELLADLGAMIAREVELDDLLATFADRVARALGADRATLWLIDGATGEHPLAGRDPARAAASCGCRRATASSATSRATGELVNIADAAADPRWDARDRRSRSATARRSMLTAPIVRRGQIRGVLQVLNKRDGAFTTSDEEFARALAEQIGRALDYTTLRGERPSAAASPCAAGSTTSSASSPAMAAVYERSCARRADRRDRAARTARPAPARACSRARSTSTARAATRRSCTSTARRCPPHLVESELFGHERGAYTGADARVIGKVEAADGGTLFLDEIGELPARRCRASCCASSRSASSSASAAARRSTADVRIVAATNRDLRRDGRRRPVPRGSLLPAARRRDRDAAAARRAAPTTSSRSPSTSPASSRAATAASRCGSPRRARRRWSRHPWPGNVRELEHAIERAVVLSRDGILEIDELGLDRPPVPTRSDRLACGSAGGRDCLGRVLARRADDDWRLHAAGPGRRGRRCNRAGG